MNVENTDIGKELSRLVEIIATLRGDNGCPWDKRQTPLSFKKYLIEECKELIDAIEADDTDNVSEEIGDMYFVITMLSAMYAEKKKFSVLAPLLAINQKMIRRHPHVFAGGECKDDEQLRLQWEKIKKQEKTG
ncbi:MazG nucleotide pyrophosphohydrolase domain-containing protein [Desulfogranum marinum]|uniref:MazG nucleotide pyrophosphohydrolase domain-containing protein n=1 Tax=Desulfogranum marinum TaxID=453220 RepID=UPI001E3BED6E|nr:MazG nucleotide pyrophosphohydrolase domain-containing protein [Desulfogranum marinum]